MRAARTAVALAAAWWATVSAYLLVLLVAAARGTRPAMPAVVEAPWRFVVLVPAHDEEAVIGDTLAGLERLDTPRELRETVVIADHCSDRTAAVAAAAGATVLEREGGPRGKAAALAWGLDALARRGEGHEVIVVLDADCAASPNLLSAVERRLRAGMRAAQVDYVVANPEAGPAAALRFAAFRLVNTVRPRGKDALGLSCGLLGSGMAFRRALLDEHPWSTTTLIEDAEQHLRLVAAGERVGFAGEARVSSPMPSSFAASESQQLRWDSGRLHLLRTFGPRLLRDAVRRRDPARANAAFELLLPPQSLLLVANVLTPMAAFVVGTRRGLRLALAALLGQLGYVLGGLLLVRAPRAVWVAMLRAPLLVAQRLRVVARLAMGRGPTSFVRTRREPIAPSS